MIELSDELVFVPLGGLGEIGMNAALYGCGPKSRRKWILIDLGLAFAGPEVPGIDLIMPDLSFVESVRKDLLALVVTHAHEDHIGAVASLWPRLGVPLYATRFAAGLLRTRRLSEPGAPDVPINIVAQNATIDLGPFSIEYIPVAHSIPESAALAIRTGAGTVVHSGDWKIDPTPLVGLPTDEKRLRAIGAEGVRALVSDSTNILREGISPSETDVAATLRDLVAAAKGRVVVTTFASNVARLRAVAQAAEAAGRTVVVVGRAMERTIEVARECGYLDGVPLFLSANSFGYLTREQMVVLATGSQGENRAALARIAEDDHPEVTLAPGDRVIFSSRTIPGNERAVGAIINGLVRQGVEVITDRTHLVHVSGHPRRAEVAQLYQWLRPEIAIPAHGEALHLAEHAAFAATAGARHVVSAHNGDVVLIGPGAPGIIDQVPHGRLYKDGDLLLAAADEAVTSRKSLSFAGVISIGIALTSKGELAGDPDVVMAGVPRQGRAGKAMDEIVDDAIFQTLDGLPRQRRRDADLVGGAVERAVRNAVRNVWGKKPIVHVLIMEV
jgi:ribonuclease J